MEREILTFGSIALVDDGSIAVAFNQGLQQVLHDLRDRPALNKKRTITLQVEFTPLHEHGHLSRADIGFQVNVKCPAKKTNSFPFKAERAGLTFFPDVADNPDQRPLPFGSTDEESEA